MTIETTRPTEGGKVASAAASRGTSAANRAGAAGAPGVSNGAAGGFANLMSLLSASDAQNTPLAAGLPGEDAGSTMAVAADDSEKTVPLSLDGQGLITLNLMPGAPPTVSPAASAPLAAGTAATPVPPSTNGATVPVSTEAQEGAVRSVPQPAMDPTQLPLAAMVSKPADIGPSQLPPAALTSMPADLPVLPTVAEPVVPVAADTQGVASVGQNSPSPSPPPVRAHLESKELVVSPATSSALVGTGLSREEPALLLNTDVANLLDHRRASQSHAAAQTQLEIRQASWQPASQQVLTAVDASRVVPAMLSADLAPASTDRREDRPGAGLARTGLEGAMGGTVAERLGINPTYEVAAATAVVPEGQVAETVSYWASHGVQSAELTLDGLGDEPVEVRISVEGDQAQIDFRSNQPDVRQALEGASAQLKALLSGEGLQLAGMSVGTSNRGASQGEGGQPKPSPRQAKLVSLEAARSSSARVGNPAVGQALDLYV